MSAGLAEVLAEHLIETCGPRCATGFNYDSNDSTADRIEGIAHLAAAVTEWLGERLREVREEVGEAIHEAEFADVDYEMADAALAVVAGALGVRDE